jgi:Flp pilus assembly protein TadG
MTIRSQRQLVLARRGTSAVEAAVVFPITMLLLVGGMVLGVGVFRYEQLQSLAREGARYASVRGPDYVASGSGSQMASTTDVSNYLSESGLSAGLSGLTCTSVTYSSTTLPCTVAVTLQYTWSSGAIFSSATWNVTATAIVTY